MNNNYAALVNSDQYEQAKLNPGYKPGTNLPADDNYRLLYERQHFAIDDAVSHAQRLQPDVAPDTIRGAIAVYLSHMRTTEPST
ncbi:MAG: hypothetical protein ACLP8S_33875 [Solirubrobacteraceae bacterium]